MTRRRLLLLSLSAGAFMAVPTVRTSAVPASSVVITSPLDGALIPRDMAPPLFRWEDHRDLTRWRVTVTLGTGKAFSHVVDGPSWRPAPDEWDRIKASSIGTNAVFRVQGVRAPASGGETGDASVSFQTSADPVGAPIFYREVPLPVGFAMDHKPLIKWKVGDVSSPEPPRTVLSGMRTCANCHSFTPDGKTLAMDIDFASDKGTYAIAPIGETVEIGKPELISWNDYRREDGESTFGLLSALAPDGRHVVSTVKETIFLQFLPDLDCSQLFFPIRGILVSYDREKKGFQSVAGADSSGFVQTNPSFSPDGRWLVFARAKVPDIRRQGGVLAPEVLSRVGPEFQNGTRRLLYDLYRLPFNDGKGGAPEPLPGASGNGKSNFFARYSPDGRWIVFCQASSMMLNRLDSALYIVPAKGGVARRLSCNFGGRMNSWHSFSPNGRWLVFASKAHGPYTQPWLTHLDGEGRDSVPILLDGFVAPDRAANIPEFVNVTADKLWEIRIASEIRDSVPNLPRRPQ